METAVRAHHRVEVSKNDPKFGFFKRAKVEISPESKKAIKKLRAIIRKGIHSWSPEVTA